MERLYLNDCLSSLHRQISASVERLKSRGGVDSAGLLNSGSGQGEAPGEEFRTHASGLLDGSVSYELSRYSSSAELRADSLYAAGSYQQAAVVDRKPTVLIDFMFEYNREFDFKV